jgi:hypothetical protein
MASFSIGSPVLEGLEHSVEVVSRDEDSSGNSAHGMTLGIAIGMWHQKGGYGAIDL